MIIDGRSLLAVAAALCFVLGLVVRGAVVLGRGAAGAAEAAGAGTPDLALYASTIARLMSVEGVNQSTDELC